MARAKNKTPPATPTPAPTPTKVPPMPRDLPPLVTADAVRLQALGEGIEHVKGTLARYRRQLELLEAEYNALLVRLIQARTR
jgi:hypothetical protein